MTKSSATAQPSTPRKTREVWHPPATAEKRAERVRLAKAFLDTFGRD